MMGCPTPGKRGFRTEALAQQRADEAASTGSRDELSPYECPCGEWHLRNQSKHVKRQDYWAKQRIRRAELETARNKERMALGLDAAEDLMDSVDRILEAMGLGDTEGDRKQVTREYESPDPPGGD